MFSHGHAAQYAALGAAALLAAALVMTPRLAAAQTQPQPGEVVTTAQPGLGAPISRVRGPIGETTEDVTDQDDSKDDAPVRDHKVHGEIMVGVGTNGYRQVAGAVTVPIGDVGQATVAVDQSQIDYHRR
jgi:hypothetical protein